MTYTSTEQSASEQRRVVEPTPSAWTGWVGFGGAMMILIGTFGAIEGLVALLKTDYYLVTKNGLLVTTNYTTWGWTHLILGVIVAAVGFGVLAGRTWARVLGIGLVMINAIVNLAFLSAYPVWATIMIAMDVVVIYALAAHGGDVRDA